jgi:secreted Zn-dependent insulinase-like peptidase
MRCMLLALVGMLSWNAMAASANDVKARETEPGQETVRTATPAKSSNDHRDYRLVTLDNGLRVLLVSDPKAEKAAVSLDVRVGSGSDPDRFPGLAHFLEHMLFLGTKDYPEAGSFEKFVGARGGRQNAYTSLTDTNYYFDIDTVHLAAALDRFAQFFSSPLFDAQYVERERNAVHSEYSTRLREDSSRISEALRSVMNPAHPAAGFMIGNLSTLPAGPEAGLRDELIGFFERFYVARNMTMAVLSPASLDELQQLVALKFAALPDAAFEPTRFDVPLYEPERLPIAVDVRPLRDTRALTLVFPMPSVLPHYRSKPTLLISHLLGHESKGSLFWTLRELGWVSSLSSGLGYSSEFESTLSVSMQLTETGLTHRREIVERFFAYADRIRADGLVAWRYDELALVSSVGLEYAEPVSSIGYVQRLASQMHRLPPNDVLISGYLLENFDHELTGRFLDRIRPDNMVLITAAPNVPVDQKGQYFGGEFSVSGIPERDLESWREPAVFSDLDLPQRNPYLPRSLAVHDGPSHTQPELIESSPDLRAWFMHDNTFDVPRTDYWVALLSPVANAGVRPAMLRTLLAHLVRYSMTSDGYLAELAGLSYEIYGHSRGLSMRISGYDPGLERFSEKLLAAIEAPEMTAERLELARDSIRKSIINRQKQRPYRLAIRELHRALHDPYWSDEDRLAALETITIDELERFHGELLGDIEAFSLAHGNLSGDKARSLRTQLQSWLQGRRSPGVVFAPRLVRLDDNDDLLIAANSEHPDTGFVRFYQGRSRSFSERAFFALLSRIAAQRFYTELRTERQLGYVVYATSMLMRQVPGLAFVIQSPDADSDQLSNEVEHFERRFAEHVASMPKREFEQHKAGLIFKLLQPDDTMTDRTGRFWRELGRGQYDFSTIDHVVAAIRRLSLDELRNRVAERTGRPAVRRLSVVVAKEGGHENNLADPTTKLSQAASSNVPTPAGSGAHDGIQEIDSDALAIGRGRF